MKQKKDILTTKRLILRPFEDHDCAVMTDILCNEEIKKTFMIPDFENRQKAETAFFRLKDFCHADDHFMYGIYLNGTLIGFLNDCEIEDNTMEIGYVIHPDYRGNGYAPEALDAAIKELFRIGYARVIASFFVENPASRRVMEKCGMHKIDIESDDEYQGKIHHCLYFAIDNPAFV